VRCLACQSTDVRPHVASRSSGNVIHGCRTCGSHALANRKSNEEVEEAYDWSPENYAAYVEVTRKDTLDRSHLDVLQRLKGMVRSDRPSLFDVGAGAGTFLAAARDAGFTPAGNELAPGAVALAKERYDIDMHLGDLSNLGELGTHDVVTMWCVLAHVVDHDELLRQVQGLLKPGGVLFLQTPRWSLMDKAGLGSADLTRGRATQLVDRRISSHHMILHTAKSIRLNLERLGYDVVEARPRVRFSLTSEFYLHNLKVSPRVRSMIARRVDGMLEREWCVRNVLDVYARAPQR
jgi:2-polyprenyl-3-methyl-5-hydroxy-6-metoxy-1,4-benzoquinol methylase